MGIKEDLIAEAKIEGLEVTEESAKAAIRLFFQLLP